MNFERGQTLIETLVAAFILVMGITAALGLAVYSLSATTNIRQQNIAIGLAREGIEVVKNIRDTNWLNDTLTSDCYDFAAGTETAYCYRDWIVPADRSMQDLSAPSEPRTFTLLYDASQPYPWIISYTKDGFGLNIADLNGATSSFTDPIYQGQDALLASSGTSNFARKITITEDTFPPFDQDTGPRLKVTSQVWWKGKNCPMTIDVPVGSNCVVTLETYLTNWKNF